MNIFASYFRTIFTGGDWIVFFPSYLHQLSFYPYLWSVTNGNGLGQNISFILGFKAFFAIFAKAYSDIFHLPWSVTEKVLFFLPFWICAIAGSYILSKIFFKTRWQRILSVLLYTINTYSLMLIGGGQMGVALAYACLPIVLWGFLALLQKELSVFRIFVASVLFGILFLLDIRLFAVAYAIAGGYLLSGALFFREFKKIWWISFASVTLLAILLNAFWLLPTGVVRDIQVGTAYTASGMVQFLSFANLEQTFGLLHPNWPENVFGLTHFMRPEFLILPLLAFSSLLWIEKDKKQSFFVIFFAILGLVGIFLSKGANDPFGIVYLWMFDHIPGFVLFRDPTKWYPFIIVSYSMLIPWNVLKIYKWIQSKKLYGTKDAIISLQNVFVVCVFSYIFFLVNPLFLGELNGTFRSHQIPQEYIRLEKFLSAQSVFSRTLWVPVIDRFGYFSNVHPAVSSEDLLNVSSISGVMQFLKKDREKTFLQDAGVHYIIVPYDSEGEIFLKDRKYDKVEYQKTVQDVKSIPWLWEISGFGRLHVFEIEDPKNHFWLLGKGDVSYAEKNPTEYTVQVKNVVKGEKLIFSESYDTHWVAFMGKTVLYPKPFDTLLNSFVLPKPGTYSLHIIFLPQKWVSIGLWVSGVTALCILAYFVLFLRRKVLR